MSRVPARSTLVAALRALVIGAGLAGHVAVAAFVLDLPPPPETGDGVPAGFAFAFALIGTVVAHVVTLVGYGLPAGEGRLRVGPLADRTGTHRLVAGGAVSVGLGLFAVVGLTAVLDRLVADEMVAVAVWVLGFGLLVGGVVGLLVGGVGVTVRLVADEVGPRVWSRS